MKAQPCITLWTEHHAEMVPLTDTVRINLLVAMGHKIGAGRMMTFTGAHRYALPISGVYRADA
jgi:hypothetical protein